MSQFDSRRLDPAPDTGCGVVLSCATMPLDQDELSYLDVYRRSRQLYRSVPHFPPPRLHRAIGDVLLLLEQKGYIAKKPAHPAPGTYQLTAAGIDQCGGLSAFDRDD